MLVLIRSDTASLPRRGPAPPRRPVIARGRGRVVGRSPDPPVKALCVPLQSGTSNVSALQTPTCSASAGTPGQSVPGTPWPRGWPEGARHLLAGRRYEPPSGRRAGSSWSSRSGPAAAACRFSSWIWIQISSRYTGTDGRGVDAEADLVAADDVDHRHGDVVADDERLADLSCQYEHGALPGRSNSGLMPQPARRDHSRPSTRDVRRVRLVHGDGRRAVVSRNSWSRVE